MSNFHFDLSLKLPQTDLQFTELCQLCENMESTELIVILIRKTICKKISLGLLNLNEHPYFIDLQSQSLICLIIYKQVLLDAHYQHVCRLEIVKF
jgi:hypothetical protein